MLPIGDDNRYRRITPLVTYALIVLNIFAFLLELSGGVPFIVHWSVVPQRLLANPFGDFRTIFTAMFLHAGWLHLLGNMLYLWIFGDNVEDRFGHLKFLLFYLICGIVATLAQLSFNPHSTVPNLGASGAIAGVLGAYLLMFPRRQVKVLITIIIVKLPAVIVIGFWIVLQFVNGFGSITDTVHTPGVAYMAHIGGFLAGWVLTGLFRGRR